MKISLSPVYNNKYSFKSVSQITKKQPIDEAKFSETEKKLAKTKKTVSECACVVLGIATVYFFAKRHNKMESLKIKEQNIEKKLKEKTTVSEVDKLLAQSLKTFENAFKKK